MLIKSMSAYLFICLSAITNKNIINPKINQNPKEMKLEYFVKKRKINNFQSGNVETKYVPELLKKTPATIESLSKEIEIGSTLSRHEAALALEEWSDVAMDALTHGRAVQVGKLGTLRLRLDAKSQNNPEEVNSKCIKNVKCVFYPSMELTRRIKKVPIHKREYMPKAVIDSQDENQIKKY